MLTPFTYTIFVLVSCFVLLSTSFGQGNVLTIYLKDGAQLQGKIIAQDDSTIVLETQYGTLDIKKVDVIKQEKAETETQQIYLNNGTVFNGVITCGNSHKE